MNGFFNIILFLKRTSPNALNFLSRSSNLINRHTQAILQKASKVYFFELFIYFIKSHGNEMINENTRAFLKIFSVKYGLII